MAEVISEGEVRVSVSTRLAEEGLKRLTNDFDHAMGSMDRRRAQARVGVDITEVDRKLSDVKIRMAEIDKEVADPRVEIDTGEAKAEMADLRAEMKALSAYKTKLRVDSKELSDANKLMDLSRKKQSDMAKEYVRTEQAKAKMHIANLQEKNDLVRLEQQYVKLSKARSRQEREGMFTLGGFPGRTKAEERELRKTTSEMDLVGAKIKQLGGDLDGLDRKDRFGSKLLEWASRMRAVRVSAGPFSAKLGTMIAAVTTLGPLLLSLVGGLSALVGVLGAGLVGATAAASAGLGGLALSMGGVFAVSKNLAGHLAEQVKAASDYRDALLKYGKGSEQAEHKLEQLHNITKGISPDARKVVMGFSGINKEWEKLTRPSRKPFFEMAGEGLKTVKALMPEFARETNATFKTLKGSVNPILKELRGSGAKGVMHDLMSNFRDALPDLIHGFRNLGVVFGNISDEASKFLPEVTQGFDKWTQHLATETGTEHFKHKLDEMIHQAGDILHLFNVAGKAVVLFFGAGAEAGDEMTNSLSRTITRWNQWMRSTEGQHSLHDFFHQSAEDTSNFFGALVPLLATFTKLTYALQPVTSGVLLFANALGRVMTVLTKFAPVRPMLEALGVTLGALFIANKVKKWTAALGEGYTWLKKLMAIQLSSIGRSEAETAANTELAASYDAVAVSAEAAGAAQATGGVAGAAGAAAGDAGVILGADGAAIGGAATAGGAAEVAGGMTLGTVLLPVGVGVGLALLTKAIMNTGSAFDDARGKFNKASKDLESKSIPAWKKVEVAIKAVKAAHEENQTAERNRGLGEVEERTPGLKGALLTHPNQAGAGNKDIARARALLKRARQEARVETRAAMEDLRTDSVFGLNRLRIDTAQALHAVSNEFKKDTPQWRTHTAKAMEATVRAIAVGMAAGTIPVKKGMEETNKLLKKIHIVRGSDPLGLAKGFANSFTSGRKSVGDFLHDFSKRLAEMPPTAAQKTRDATMSIVREWAKGHPKIEAQVDLMNKHLEHRFGKSNTQIAHTTATMAQALTKIFGGLGTTVGGVLEGMSSSVQRLLVSFGVNAASKFTASFGKNALENLTPSGKIPGLEGQGDGKKRKRSQRGGGLQEGGFTVPGSGDGDQFYHEAEEGGYVLNREASRAAGFQRGGVPVVLEPGERYFAPHEAQAIGHDNLEALNAAIPRFQLGGEPHLNGPPGSLRTAGQVAIHKSWAAAQKAVAKARAKAAASSGGIPHFSGPWVTVMQKIAKAKHWSLSDWKKILQHESGGQPSAQNPKSSAFGLGQLLDMNWPTYGGGPGSSAVEQIEAMARYIADRYGNPTAAWAEEEAIGTYKRGGAIQRLQEGGTATRAVNWAKNNIGVKQGGHRYDKWIAETGRIADPWCAEFVAADMVAQGVPMPGNPSYTGSYGSSWSGGDVVGNSLGSAKPGDLLAFGSDDHIGIYVGGGMVVAGNWNDEVAEYKASDDSRGVSRVTRPHYPGGYSDPKGGGAAAAKPKGPKAGSVGKGGGVNAPPGSASPKEIANTIVGATPPGKIDPELAKLLPKSVRKELKQPGLTGEDRSNILSGYQGKVQTEGTRATTALERADTRYTSIHEKALAHPGDVGLQESDKRAGEADTAAHNVAVRARKREVKAAKALLIPLRHEKKRVGKRIREIDKALLKGHIKASVKKRLIEERTALYGTLATLQSSINEELETINLEPVPPSAVEVAIEEAAEGGGAEGGAESGTGGGSGGGGGGERLSLGEQTATLSSAREDLFNNFASNVGSGGGGAFSGAAAAVSGMRAPHFVSVLKPRDIAARSGGIMGAVHNTINNYFAAPPADPHTWTRQQAFELQALA